MNKPAEQQAPEPEKKRKKKKGNWRAKVLGIAFALVALVFLPITIVIAIGMLPTPMAAVTERIPRRKKTKIVCVGAMNLAGCVPFILELMKSGADFEAALNIITNPLTIIVMYAAATLGYVIDWAMTGVVAGVMYDKGRKRQQDIKNTQADLVERWGREVTGDEELDAQGFMMNKEY